MSLDRVVKVKAKDVLWLAIKSTHNFKCMSLPILTVLVKIVVLHEDGKTLHLHIVQGGLRKYVEENEW